LFRTQAQQKGAQTASSGPSSSNTELDKEIETNSASNITNKTEQQTSIKNTQSDKTSNTQAIGLRRLLNQRLQQRRKKNKQL